MRRKVEGLTLRDTCTEVRGVAESVISLPHRGPRDQSQVISLDDKNL